MTLHLDMLERRSAAVEPKRRSAAQPFQFMPMPLLIPVPTRRRRPRTHAMATAVPFSSNLSTAATLAGATSILFLQLVMLGLFILSL